MQLETMLVIVAMAEELIEAGSEEIKPLLEAMRAKIAKEFEHGLYDGADADDRELIRQIAYGRQ